MGHPGEAATGESCPEYMIINHMFLKGNKPSKGKRNNYLGKNGQRWARIGKIGQHRRAAGEVCPAKR